MSHTLSLIPLLVALVEVARSSKAAALTPAPFSASFCLFQAGNYSVGETWHPFLSPNGYVCIKCSCVFVASKGVATVKCDPLCKDRTCSQVYGKCCSTCPISVGTYKYQTCTDRQGQRHSHQSVWAVPPKNPSILKTNQCTECSCLDGFISCAIKNCPRVSCRNPQRQNGTCCKTCLQGPTPPTQRPGCYSMGRFYTEGAMWHPQVASDGPKCYVCTCKKLTVNCQRLKCPTLSCANPVREHPGDCCKTCSLISTATTTATAPTTQIRTTPFNPNCTLGSNPYANGSQWHPVVGSYGKQLCVLCKCLNARITCSRICKGSPTRRSVRSRPCWRKRHWRVLKYVPSGQNLKSGTFKIKFALVKSPNIEMYKLSAENTTNQVWKVNKWKLKVGNQANVLKALNNDPNFRAGGRFKEIGFLRNRRQKDYLNKLVFRRCSSQCAAQLQEVENYLKTTRKARRCRLAPTIPRSLRMLTPDD